MKATDLKLYQWDAESGGGISVGADVIAVQSSSLEDALGLLRDMADQLRAETGLEYFVAVPDGEVLYHTLAEEVWREVFGGKA